MGIMQSYLGQMDKSGSHSAHSGTETGLAGISFRRAENSAGPDSVPEAHSIAL